MALKDLMIFPVVLLQLQCSLYSYVESLYLINFNKSINAPQMRNIDFFLKNETFKRASHSELAGSGYSATFLLLLYRPSISVTL